MRLFRLLCCKAKWGINTFTLLANWLCIVFLRFCGAEAQLGSQYWEFEIVESDFARFRARSLWDCFGLGIIWHRVVDLDTIIDIALAEGVVAVADATHDA